MKGFVFDHCFIHPPEISSTHLSDPATTRYAERGFAANASDMFIVNSYIAGFTGNYPNGGGIEASEDVLMDGGPGPLHVVNNYLEAWYSSVFIGGADASPLPEHTATVSDAETIGTATLSTVLDLAVGDLVAFKLSDPPAGETQPIWGVGRVTDINGNTISYTPLTALYQSFDIPPMSPGEARWRGEVLHDVEIKGNTMVKRPEWSTFPMSGPKNWIEIKAGRRVTIEGNLVTSETPSNITLTVRNQNGSSPWVEISSLTFRNNKLINFKDPGFSIQLQDNEKVTGQSGNVVIENNLMISPSGDSKAFLTNGGHDVVFSHNTILNSQSLGGGENLPTKNLTLIDNIVNNGPYGLSCFIGDGARSTCWPGLLIESNVIVDNQRVGGLSSIYPSGNFFPPSDVAVGWVDSAKDDYRLSESSPYKGMASDGTDPGIDQDALTAALAGATTPSGPSGTETSGPSATETPGPPDALRTGPSDAPTLRLTGTPTPQPSDTPTPQPSDTPTPQPSDTPTLSPSPTPTPGLSGAPAPSPSDTLRKSSTGEIPYEKAKLEDTEILIYEYPVPPHLSGFISPPSRIPLGDQELAHYTRLQILVVHSEFFPKLLSRFGGIIDDRR